MPAPLVVPTVFTAVDKLSGVIQRMQRSVGGFAGKASIGINALNNGINSLIPSFGKLAKQAIGLGATYAVFQGLRAGGSALVDFEKNVAGLRVILDDLSDKQFDPYKKQIIDVARATRVSAVDVAASFEKIAELNYDLAKTPEGLAGIAKSAITLSRAARIELTPATEGLIAIMSQFDVKAKDADRLSNALAAGFKFGSASIEDQIESYKGFGTVAKEANVTMEQSIALTQTLAKYQLKGAESGTALRSAIIHLQNAGAGYKSGKFSLNDALDEMRKKLASLKNDKSRDALLNALFGIRAVTQGRLLGRSAELMASLTRNVSGTNEAFKQANITTETFASKWDQLTGSIATYLVSNDGANKGLERLKRIIVYVTDNLDSIIDKIVSFGKIFLWVKGIIWLTQGALFIFNVAMGITGAVTGLANIAIVESRAAMIAYRATLILTGNANLAFGGTMTTVKGSFLAAEGAAKGFFATLGAFAIPAALLTLAGMGFADEFRSSHARSAKRTIDQLPLNSPELKAYLAWSANQRPAPGQNWSDVGTPEQFLDYWERKTAHNFKPVYGDSNYKPMPVLGRTPNTIIDSTGLNASQMKTAQEILLHINMNDPNKHIKSTTVDTKGIPVKVTRTTPPGNK